MTTPSETPDSDQRSDRALIRTVYVLGGIVGVVVLMVSSYYLFQYGRAAGMDPWLAWTLVVALDVAGAAGTICWVLTNSKPRYWGRIIAVANLAASVLGNVLGHTLKASPANPSDQVWLQILTGIVYPAELSAILHLVLVLRAWIIARRVPVPTHVPADVPKSLGYTPVPTDVPVPTPPAVPVPTGVPTDVPTPVPTRAGDVPLAVPTVYLPPKAVPTPVPTGTRTNPPAGVPDDLVARARAYRASLTAKGQPAGRDAIRTHFNLTDRDARELIRKLNTEPSLKAVPGGTR